MCAHLSHKKKKKTKKEKRSCLSPFLFSFVSLLPCSLFKTRESDVAVMSSIKELNDRLTKQPYVSGYTPSAEDEKLFRQVFGDNVNVIQWAARMATYYPSERAKMQPVPPETEDSTESEDDY